MYAALLHFQYLLEGQKFVIFTDHRPLVGAIGRLSDPKSDRQRRHTFKKKYLHVCKILSCFI
jgi:hypothetical protein